MDDSKQLTPKMYKRNMPILWWTQRNSHLRFVLRELTSLAVAYFAVVLMLLIRSVSQGEAAYQRLIDSLSSPAIMILSVIALVGLVFHSITWFNLAPSAMVIKVGKHRVPGVMIALSNYIGWIIISGALVWILF